MRLPALTAFLFVLQGFPLASAMEGGAPIAATALQCPAQDFKSLSASIAPGTVKSTGPTVVYAQAEGCRQGSCGAYPPIPPSTKVIVESHDDQFACVTYPSGKGNGYGPGLVKLNDIDIGPNDRPKWEGLWVLPGKSYIKITKVGESYRVAGETSYGAEGNESFGQVDGISMSSGPRMIVKDRQGISLKTSAGKDEGVSPCTVDLIIAGDLMKAGDNMSCGSTNVRFMGTYKRYSGHYDIKHFFKKQSPASRSN